MLILAIILSSPKSIVCKANGCCVRSEVRKRASRVRFAGRRLKNRRTDDSYACNPARPALLGDLLTSKIIVANAKSGLSDLKKSKDAEAASH